MHKLLKTYITGLKQVRGWFFGVLLAVQDDGNCLFTAWMVSCVLDAGMSREKLEGIRIRACLVRETKAYRALDQKYKVS